MINKIWEILTTLSDEAQKTASAKCNELGFDPSRGIISLEESFINLSTARLILMDAIEKQKLIQLPITVQTTILKNLESISKFLTGLINGTDEVINLKNAIEELNTKIWQYGFYNLSNEVLGYQTKMNQLKTQDIEINKLKGEIEHGLKLKNDLNQFLAEVKKTTETIREIAATSEENNHKTSENMNRTTEDAQKAGELLLTIQQTKTKTDELSSDIGILKQNADDWANEVKKLAKKSEEIGNNIENQKEELNKLINLTDQTHKQVESLLPGAASAGLASAFMQRKKEISKSKKWWVIGFIASLLLLIGFVIWLVNSFSEHAGNIEWWRFFLQRAPVTFPAIWLGWFFGRNYGHLVRLEEDYAFKESISRSFEGYKKQMQEVDPSKALPQLCANTISILSEPPLRVFDRKTTDETPANSILERFMPKRKQGE